VIGNRASLSILKMLTCHVLTCGGGVIALADSVLIGGAKNSWDWCVFVMW